MSNNKFEFHFHAPVGQNIANVEHMDVHLDKAANVQIANIEQANIKKTKVATSTTGQTVVPKKSSHFLPTPSLIYKYKDDTFDGPRRLTILFRYLCKEYEPTKTWIDPETSPDVFLSLFIGDTTDAVIVWTAQKQKLFGLFKRMKERKIISTPKGCGLWQIVQNHFSDWHGNMFQDFNKEHMPKEPTYSAIEAFVDILDPALTSNADLDEYAKKIGISFGNR